MQDRYFSDEELVAYLDGETDFTPADAIDRVRTTDTALQKRIEALTLEREAVAEAFEDLLDQTSPVPPELPLSQRKPPLRYVVSGVGMAACVALGVLIGVTLNPGRSDWTDYVAAYHALYSSSTVTSIQNPDVALQAELDRVAASIGKKISLEQLKLFPGLRYVRAQTLGFKGQALVQLIFLTGTDDPVALCIIRSGTGQAVKPELLRMEGLSTALWSQDGFDYMLIGGTDDALVERLSFSLIGMGI